MPFHLIPYGKGTGKLWIIGLIITLLLLWFIFGYGDLMDAINSGETVSPIIIILAKVVYPIYVFLIWILNFIIQWGFIAVIPILIVVVGIVALLNKIIERSRR